MMQTETPKPVYAPTVPPWERPHQYPGLIATWPGPVQTPPVAPLSRRTMRLPDSQ